MRITDILMSNYEFRGVKEFVKEIISPMYSERHNLICMQYPPLCSGSLFSRTHRLQFISMRVVAQVGKTLPQPSW